MINTGCLHDWLGSQRRNGVMSKKKLRPIATGVSITSMVDRIAWRSMPRRTGIADAGRSGPVTTWKLDGLRRNEESEARRDVRRTSKGQGRASRNWRALRVRVRQLPLDTAQEWRLRLRSMLASASENHRQRTSAGLSSLGRAKGSRSRLAGQRRG